jgi:hypothetical protein
MKHQDKLGQASLAAAMAVWLAVATLWANKTLLRVHVPEDAGEPLGIMLVATAFFAIGAGLFSYSAWGSSTGHLAFALMTFPVLLFGVVIIIMGVFCS